MSYIIIKASGRKAHQPQKEDSSSKCRGHKHKDRLKSLSRVALERHHGQISVPHCLRASDRKGHQPQVEASSSKNRGHSHNDNTATQQLIQAGLRTWSRAVLEWHYGERYVPHPSKTSDRNGYRLQIEGGSNNDRGHNDAQAAQQLALAGSRSLNRAGHDRNGEKRDGPSFLKAACTTRYQPQLEGNCSTSHTL
eukprot:5148615-Pleurochrysis_carterae.AAC.1